MKSIIGVGSLNVDITAYAPHLPVHGETTLGDPLRIGPGGKGNNQMTAAHRAGAPVKMISRVGDDFLSRIMLQHYKDEGMTSEYIKVVPGGQTGGALIEVDTQTAQNRIIVVKGVCDSIPAADVLAAEADFQACGVVLTQLETSMESVLTCKELAKKYNKPFILNPAPFQDIPEALFDGTDYLTPNETEAEFFSGVPVKNQQDARAAAERLLAMGIKNVIITLGKAGVYWFDGQNELQVPGLPVEAVDTTGAGDAFNGGFAAALAADMDIETALRFATCTAALSVTRRGAAPAMPQRAEIDALMERAYGTDY